MKIKNNTVKLIGIAETIIMPGDEVEIPDKLINDNVLTLEKMGMLTITKAQKKAETAKILADNGIREEVVKETVVAPVKRAPRKKKTE